MTEHEQMQDIAAAIEELAPEIEAFHTLLVNRLGFTGTTKLLTLMAVTALHQAGLTEDQIFAAFSGGRI